MPGDSVTAVDFSTLSREDLAIAAKDQWSRIGPQMPAHLRDEFEPLYQELVARVASIDTPDAGGTF